MMNRVSQGLLAIGNWCATMSFTTCVVYRIICKSCKETNHLVFMLIVFYMFNFFTTFDIDVNGGERVI